MAWNIFRPKWQSKDPDVRRQSVDRLGDVQTLATLARTDPSAAVRMAAVAKLLDASILIEVVAKDTDMEVCKAALKALKDPDALVKIALTDAREDIAVAAVNRLESASQLVAVVSNATRWSVRRAAFDKIYSDEGLFAVATMNLAGFPPMEARYLAVRAVNKIRDEETLVRIALDGQVLSASCSAAMKIKIKDQKRLELLASRAKDVAVRLLACWRIMEVASLYRILESDDQLVKRYVVRCLVLPILGPEDQITRLLGHADVRIRSMAVELLTDSSKLMDLAADPSPEIRAAARVGLRDLPLGELRRLRGADLRTVVHQLGYLGPRASCAVPRLTGALLNAALDSDPRDLTLILAIIETLGRSRDSAAVPVLRGILSLFYLSTSPDDSRIGEACAMALGRIGDASALEELKLAAFTPGVMSHGALLALAMLGDSSAEVAAKNLWEKDKLAEAVEVFGVLASPEIDKVLSARYGSGLADLQKNVFRGLALSSKDAAADILIARASKDEIYAIDALKHSRHPKIITFLSQEDVLTGKSRNFMEGVAEALAFGVPEPSHLGTAAKLVTALGAGKAVLALERTTFVTSLARDG